MTIKAKGRLSTPAPGKHDLKHSLNHVICADAVKAYLADGTPIVTTVTGCTDINRFIITHAATGKFMCYYGDLELGKLIRFYKSTQATIPQITKVGTSTDSTAQVPSSENCVPAQNLPKEFPLDLDYDWYIDKAQEWVDLVTKPKTFGGNLQAQQFIAAGLYPIPVGEKSSNAFLAPGTFDFNSMPPGTSIGISTGKKAGVVAVVDEATQCIVLLYRFNGKLPTRTRKKIGKDLGWRIVYGSNVKVPPGWTPKQQLIIPLHEDSLREWYRAFYTESELKKVGVEL